MKHHPTVKQMLDSLIATPSVSSVSPEFDQSNRGVIDLLANWLNSLGFSIEVLPLPEQPNKANLIATLGGGGDDVQDVLMSRSPGRGESDDVQDVLMSRSPGRGESDGGLVLAGHTDTVPFDEKQWKYNPFKLIEADNRYYGLGTADMKSFFALAIEAACRFEATDLKRPLILLATADEESSMEGVKSLVRSGKPRARYAVIGEPTGLRPVRMHKGIIMEAVHAYGRAGHSSDPSLGVNAIEGLHQVLRMLLNWRSELQAHYTDERFKVPVPTLNLGLVAGGDNPNRICSHAQVHFDLRMLPGMDPEQLRAELDNRLRALSQGPVRFLRQSLIDGTPPLHTPSGSPLVLATEALTGHGCEAVAFCTEGPYLNSLGMDTVILGPGDIAQAHQPDEYLALERINPTVDLLERLIRRFCVE